MRKMYAVGALMLMAATLVPMGSAGASPGDAAKCYHTSWFYHDPALTMEPNSGKMRSAERGTIECYGVIDGVAVAGVGTYTWKGEFGTAMLSPITNGNNCFIGDAFGEFKAEVPTLDGGTLRLRGHFNFVRGLHAGREWGEINGVPYEGVLRGDTPDVIGRSCSEVPITKSNIYSDIVLGASAGP